VENYKAELESDIKEAVKNITGSKNISVVITLESSVRYSYADQREKSSANKTESEQQSTQNDLKESYITIKTSDGGEQALLVTAKMPEIRGVAIVCEGGDDEIIAEKIKNAVTAAFGITSKRVYICGRKQ
jgi:stage III sporulation protein AG